MHVEAPRMAEYLPATQSVHMLAPGSNEYLPTAQSEHSASAADVCGPGDPYLPAVQGEPAHTPDEKYVPGRTQQTSWKPVVHFLKTSPQVVGTSKKSGANPITIPSPCLHITTLAAPEPEPEPEPEPKSARMHAGPLHDP